MSTAENRARGTLAGFLRRHREAIDPESRVLGQRDRSPSRLGKRVSQQEMAEALGISREWYSALESGGTMRTSARVVDAFADVVGLSQEQRLELLRLAVPEVAILGLRATSVEVLAALGTVRDVAKKLFAAASEGEVLQVVGEGFALLFPEAAHVMYSQRHASGVWDMRYVVDRERGRSLEVARGFAQTMTPAQVDELFLFPAFSQPGSLATQNDYAPGPVFDRIVREFFSPKEGVRGALVARIRVGDRLVASCSASFFEVRQFSEEELAIAGALADLASLAMKVTEK